MPEMTIEALAQEMRTQVDAVKAIAEDFQGKAAHNDTISAGAKQAADEALTKMNELAAQFQELEQKAARRGADEPQIKSLGQQFVDDKFEGIKSTNGRGRFSMEVKATINSATGAAAGSAGALVEPTRLAGIIAPPDQKLTIRDLLLQGQMDGSAIQYVIETGFTNNAATVAELAKKPESDIKLDTKDTSAKVIAHTMKASRQILDDASQLRSYIDGRLRYGLKLKEENQILNGDGTGSNLFGILPQARAYAKQVGASTTLESGLDTFRYAMLQAVLAEYPASGFVLNPIDWANIETLKDTSGQYLIGNPKGTVNPTVWGLPVVQTQAIAQGKFLTGAFNLGAQIFDRWQSRVEIATENEDDFVKNLVTILCEERLALAVYRPESFIYGDVKPAP